MASNLPPGPAFLILRLPTLLFPLIAVYAFNRLLYKYLAIQLPLWTVIVSMTLSIPVFILLKASYMDFIDHRRAAACGAVIPPRIHDIWPAGIGLLIQGINNLKSGYPG
ncbi:hypothetical protein H0H81_001344 [Sphagnurus paluster]|uniref:Uncharacterized protein n=1 Tax=Sphagnurus paluster TaxID=117069 RepID=A0A9P7KLZ9_9AGAR|nr:hypothetical protein H0H81_001344 [Sphagnurus paluster]